MSAASRPAPERRLSIRPLTSPSIEPTRSSNVAVTCATAATCARAFSTASTRVLSASRSAASRTWRAASSAWRSISAAAVSAASRMLCTWLPAVEAMGMSLRSIACLSSSTAGMLGDVAAWGPANGSLARGRFLGADLLEVATQLAQLVAQLCRILEAQLIGGRDHLLLQLDLHPLELVPGHLGCPAPDGAALAAPRHLGLPLQELRDVRYSLDDRRGRYAVLLVVGELDLAAAIGLGDRGAHRACLLVGVHQHGPVHVARGPADGLDQRGLPAQEALLVGVQDRHQRDLRQIQALAQQVHADEHVVLAQSQVADDLDALQRVDLRVQVARLEAHLQQVLGEVLAHLLGQRRDQHALTKK